MVNDSVECFSCFQPSENHPGSQLDFAKRRLQLGESLYYKTLEGVLQREKKKLEMFKDQKSNVLVLVSMTTIA